MRSLTVKTRAFLPTSVDLGDGPAEVVALAEHWVVEVGWWRTAPQRWERRRCWRVLLRDGRCLNLYWDGVDRAWRLGRMWG